MKRIYFLLLLLFFSLKFDAAQFNIIYGNVIPPTDVVAALQRSVQIINYFMVLQGDINIEVFFTPLPGSILAQSSPSHFCVHPNSALYPYMLVPAALYVQLTGLSNCPLAGDNIHISVQFNSNPPTPFYFGLDGVKSTSKLDFISVAIHEFLHGLGMTSFIDSSSADNPFSPYSSVYDWNIFYKTSVPGWPTSYSLPVGSPAITAFNYLTSNLLYFNGSFPYSYFQLYTPFIFNPGSSISHTAYVGLMYYSIAPGFFYHTLDDHLFGMLQTFGYNMVNCSTPDVNRCGNCLANYACFTYPPSSSSAERFVGFLEDIVLF